MKHETRIVLILLLMFIATQLIGLSVIDSYAPKTTSAIVNGTLMNVTVAKEIPYGMQPPEVKPQVSLLSIVISLAIAILIFFLLTKLKARIVLKTWFVLVIYITVAVALAAILSRITGIDANALALVLAIPLTFFKAIRPNMIVHNATELLIYPGLAAVFVPILRIWSIIVLLLLISVYDMWAVWKSTLMVKMAKYQIENLKIFTGFFIPYLPKGARIVHGKAKGKKVKVSIALLGGGDVAFPLIFAGVIYRAAGLIPALIIIAGATLSLLLLFMFSKKGKFYPAMPFITSGCLLAYLISLLV